MKKLIIDRKKWRRGHDDGNTYLLAENGMCCLGFDTINEGFSNSEIKDCFEPANLCKKIMGLTKPTQDGSFENTVIATRLMIINDSENYTEENREKKITKLFSKIGRKVEFIN